tara:strand:- start:2835 stop:3467 length:633 start_codon:yes stop_codon:yes gene_type:complete
MEYKFNPEQKFTEQWFDAIIPMWDKAFKIDSINFTKIKNVLEIGCYEGRATSYLCSEHLLDGTNYDVVDTFGGSLEEDGMSGTAERLKESDFIFNNFNHNISFYPKVNFEIYRGYSHNLLPKLNKDNKKYDFIYIDASHRADDTFVDAYYAHKMLNKDGILIFDDFAWKDPTDSHPVVSPELGIRQFFTMYKESYNVVFTGYQVAAQKTT